MNFPGPPDPTSWPNKISLSTLNKSFTPPLPPIVPQPPEFKFSSTLGDVLKGRFEFTSILSLSLIRFSPWSTKDK
jgi:hypothetical protein